MNFPLISKGLHDVVTGAASTVEGVLANFPTPILLNIARKSTREDLIYIHIIISANEASVVSNLRGGHHVHLNLTMAVEDYLGHMARAFVPLHKPGDYPPRVGTSQERALSTKRF